MSYEVFVVRDPDSVLEVFGLMVGRWPTDEDVTEILREETSQRWAEMAARARGQNYSRSLARLVRCAPGVRLTIAERTDLQLTLAALRLQGRPLAPRAYELDPRLRRVKPRARGRS